MDSLHYYAALLSASETNVPVVDANTLLSNGLSLVYFVAGAVAVIVIIVAGINYATSGGEASKITKAKNMILFASIGLVVVFTAFAITKFILGVLQ